MHITNVNTRLHKIGYSNDVERRRRELSREFCTPLIIVDCIDVEDDKKVEMWLHDFFATERVQPNDELFLLDELGLALWHNVRVIVARNRGRGLPLLSNAGAVHHISSAA